MEFRERDKDYERYNADEGQSYRDNFDGTATAGAQQVDISGLSTYVSQVFMWMTAGLLLTAGTSWFVLSSEQVFYAVIPFVMPLFVVELGLVWWMAGAVHRMKPGTATALFFTYAAINGITLAPLIFQYTAESVASTFMITAGTFAVMAFYGLTTKKDLTSMGSLLLTALLGVILAMVVNLFLQSGPVSIAISCLCVFIFVGLIAYDTQQIKAYYVAGMESSAEGQKYAILAALSLYLDFINLFIHLLSLLGNRD